MNDLLGCEGKRRVITGCDSGMGEAAARVLCELGVDHGHVASVEAGQRQGLL